MNANKALQQQEQADEYPRDSNIEVLGRHANRLHRLMPQTWQTVPPCVMSHVQQVSTVAIDNTIIA